MAKEKVLTLTGLTKYDEEIKKKIVADDTTTLASAKEYADGLGVQYDPAGTAQTKVDALKNGEVKTNTDNITALQSGKADKATTLKGYGIADAYTKEETKSEITSAVANADHLKRVIVEQLPEVEAADEHTIYMVKKKSSTGDNAYDEYMVVNVEGVKKLEKIGDSAVDLTNYATKEEVGTAKQEAITTATQNAKDYSDGLANNYATAEQGTKADTALQKADIVSGTGNGTISVKGEDVAVKGLASAAYAETSAFDAAGTATTKVNELANGAVKTNSTDIASLKEKVNNLETNGVIAITDEEIHALFQ